MARTPFEVLQQATARAVRAQAAWEKGTLEAAQGHVQELKENVKQFEGERHALLELRAKLTSAAQALQEQLGLEAEEERQQAEALAGLRQTQALLPPELARQAAELDADERELDAEEADLAAQEARQGARLAAAQHVHHLFVGSLGIALRTPGPGAGAQRELVLAFTELLPAQREAECRVGLHLDPRGAYTVTRCEPSVPEAAPLLAQLNRDNQVKDFVRGLRRAFQGHLRAGGAPADPA